MTTYEVREESLREMGCTPRMTYSEFVTGLERLLCRLGMPGGYELKQLHSRHRFGTAGERTFISELRWHLDVETTSTACRFASCSASSLESLLAQVADKFDPERMPSLESLDVHTIVDAAGATS